MGGGSLFESSQGESEVAVVVIDAHDVVHAGIEAWATGSQPRMKVVGHYAHPGDFIEDHPTASSVVDVVLFGLEYGARAPVFDALRQVCRAGHRVVVYSHLDHDEVILNSLDAGAVCYVVKSESGMHLAEAIYAAGSETPYVAPAMARALHNGAVRGRPRLSTRECQVLIAWCQTENKDVVAKRLFIEPSTVRTHLQRVRAKYAAIGRPAPTKAALIARAIQDGILDVDEL
ncbi:response regulator transcription factor [Mycolicibacterium sp. F2034L]|uniref:response regulator transcription factor n=1 Tax=Mycolicibacterium sp. F2034L TaxID=2926422 RepID=UPI001FF6FA78|nr:response regulator transcription factor [Mycolicibacterium sp. F2034L]MCK0177628.1 response regulator transcription factor [Mycolicibacterium sp. F2034L]